MNNSQKLWWVQARSDHDIFQLLLGQCGDKQCHLLHYLQMTTEKIAKAYFWRSNVPPPKDHAGFVQFLRFLGQIRKDQRERVANIFNFRRFSDFQLWIRSVLPFAFDLERLSPNLALDGPNAEYPWPHKQPQYAPDTFDFDVWKRLKTAQGRQLIRMISIAVNEFPDYSDT